MFVGDKCYLFTVQITRLVAEDADVDEGNRVPITYAITSIIPSQDIVVDGKCFVY